jgi:exodeoxyribonuclease-3
MITIASWNVNSIRTRIELVKSWLESYQPDIVLLQEIKCINESFPYNEIEDLGYNVKIHGQKSYNGVAILSKFIIEDAHIILPNNPDPEQSRYIEALIALPNKKMIRVASVYVPNGQSPDSDKFIYKLNFLKSLQQHMRTILEFEEILIVGGDFNIAPEELDVYDPKELDGTVCFHPSERIAYRKILNLGMYDAFRLKYPSKKSFSWWDYRAGSWQRNLGMRIDHLLLSPEATDLVADCVIHDEIRGKDKSSDHAPIMCKLEDF